jgi:hypothetical protein
VTKNKDQVLKNAREAKRLSEDEGLLYFLTDIEDQIHDSFKACDLDDELELRRLQAEQYGITSLRRRLRIAMDAGVIAEKGVK